MKHALLLALVFFSIFSQAQFTSWGYGPDLSISQTGGNLTATYSDPDDHQTHTYTATGITNEIYQDGVITYEKSGYIFTVIYYVAQHRFAENYYSISGLQSLTLDNGVVAAMGNSYVHYSIFDPINGSWDHSYFTLSNGTTLINKQGVVAAMSASLVEYAVFDAYDHSWHYSYYSVSNVSDLKNTDGVVSSTEPTFMQYATYDYGDHGWHESYSTISNITDYDNKAGVVASIGPSSVEYASYDPSRHHWSSSHTLVTASTSSFSVSNGAVHWTEVSTQHNQGYSVSSGNWENATYELYCKLFVSNSSGNSPLLTRVNVMSIGADSYNYDFGDGQQITRRSAWKQYENGGSYTVDLTVSNSSHNSSCSASVDVSTGIKAPRQTRLKVYPNPAHDKIQIESDEVISAVSIFDALGREVKSSNLTAGPQIDITDIRTGVYILNIKFANGNMANKSITIE